MRKHTPESWVNDGYVVYFPGGEGGFSLRDCPQPEDKARRIVACINACVGLPLEQLEGSPIGGIMNGVAGLVTNRDYLLSALKRIAAYPETSQQELGIEAIKAIARVAIEKAEGDENEPGDK